jgi:hypothetical protein
MKQYINELIDQLTEKHEPLRIFSKGYAFFLIADAIVISIGIWCCFGI